jgi:hypothetical protein
VVTLLSLWLAFGQLARDYGAGLQTLNESVAAPRSRGRRRGLDGLLHRPPLRWWLRDSVSRAAFRLTAAYLFRDRDVKLRVYPGIAPIMVMPLLFLFQDFARRGGSGGGGGFTTAFAGSYLGLVPLLGLNLLQYSQQWQAADLFRVAPMPGPAPLCHGARRAVLCLLAFPVLVGLGLLAWLVKRDVGQLELMLPGIIALPVYALLPCLGGRAVPLSLPTEEAKSAGRGLTMIGVMLVALALAGVTSWAWQGGWLWWLVAGETVLVAGLYAGLRHRVTAARWPSID